MIGIGSLLLICAYGGLVVFAFYHDCDPLTTKQVLKKDQLFPLFVMQVMGDYPGVPGSLQCRPFPSCSVVVLFGTFLLVYIKTTLS